ncbi:28S ribosomal protein S25, mitochondrial isoform X5 [Balaenoptera musculus]|uniref:Small ribosomal subunit protein mS25 n=1 Tax=Balaenoptera musculus TaxID=9771 RepID=A0A8B8YUF8_BALMU|nr:28S ribosomal protein S25, mitochondrial isoform X5 [Balaenoptera musculus]
MSMKGRFPIRRTLQYLGQGDVVFKDSVKVMTVNYNTHGELGEGARKFVFFNIPQIQYKNPWVQIMMFKNMTPTPFLRFYLDSGEQVLVDVETKSNKEIMEHIKKILGKSEKVCVASGHHTKEWLHWEDAEGMVLPTFSLKRSWADPVLLGRYDVCAIGWLR